MASALLAVAAAVVGAAPAGASTLSVHERDWFEAGALVHARDLLYVAAPGELNDVVVDVDQRGDVATWLDFGAVIVVAPEHSLAAKADAIRNRQAYAGCSAWHVQGTALGDRRVLGSAICVAGYPFRPVGCQLCQEVWLPFVDIAIRTGDGDDAVDAADGRRERIDCGTGTDAAHVDPVDSVVGCEQVTRPPSP